MVDKLREHHFMFLRGRQNSSSSLGTAPVTLVMKASDLRQKSIFSRKGFIHPLMIQ